MERVVPAADPHATPLERSGFVRSPDYAQTVAYLRSIDAGSRLISLHAFGKSYQGRELYYVLAGKPGAGKPGARKPVVLVQAGIHAGEVDGKDAGLMLLRDIAQRGRDDLLDHVDLVFIPILNVDAHENASEAGRPHQRGPFLKGARTSAQGLDLNRDYARLQSPEVAAVVKLLQQFDPALYIDVHVSDGIDYQYDVTYTFAGWGTYARSQATAQWLMTAYSTDVDKALTADGHLPAAYPSWVDENAPHLGLRISAEGPRYSTGYGDFMGIPTVLVENHTMKPYRQRVLGTYVLLEQSLKTVAREHARIAAAKDRDRAARPAQLMVRWERESVPREVREFKGYRYDSYLSPASGARELRWTGEPQTIAMPVFGVRSTREVTLPRAWWIRPEHTGAIALLRSHGIRMEVLDMSRAAMVDVAQMANGGHRQELRRPSRSVTMPAGSVRIPADQPGRLLAAALLEPESDDSMLANGMFDHALPPESALSRHLLAPLADRLLETAPGLRALFQDAIAKDAAFAADPQARLNWWLERSEYGDRSSWTYPVMMERR
ncbi:M14 family metallopeptidase [Pseudoduganella plicata]|nr:M14 family metallopeptidase [Pseudoduganella plicata]GGY88256.1 hypothetical protein GCM10007388_22100 [Pseudoduganella plicata]